MGTETTPRERLIAMVAALKGPLEVETGVAAMWKVGEDYVAALEAAPDEPRACPCCTKLVTLCTKRYQLHEPGKPCLDCGRDA